MKFRLRLLPLTIFAAVLMLSLRAGQFWEGLETISGSVSVAETQAQMGPGEEAPPEKAEEKTGAEVEAAEEVMDVEVDPFLAIEEGAKTEFSEAEIELLQNLAVRRQVLDRREREIEMREALLAAAEQRVDSKIAQLKELQNTIQSKLKQYDEQESANLRSLVKIYENMKSKDAARIFEQLDMAILLEVIDGMNERKSAPILAKMDPLKAKSITSELAVRRRIPRDENELEVLQRIGGSETGG